MRLTRLLFVAAFGLAASLAQAAGIKPVKVNADATGPALKAFVWTPCASTPAATHFGPIVVTANRNCPIVGDHLPLVVISHGHGGGSLNHHDTAEALADAGFIVVALDHPGDNFADKSHTDDIAAMFERPTDIKRLIDFMLAASPDAAKIDAERIGLFGFSRGGYTGLVIAGATPDFHDARIPCPEAAPICGEIRDNRIPQQPLARDPRVKALALADPLTPFPTAESLRDVKAPVQLWSSQYGGDGVLPENVAALTRDLPEKPEFHFVPASAHFAFLAPCPAEMAAASPALCRDAPGFDRAAFHASFNAAVVAFFRAHLPQ